MLSVTYADIGGLDRPLADIPLSAYRRERLERVKSQLAKHQGLGAELLLIRALRRLDAGAALPLEISVGKTGKPYFSGKSLYFSLSHSDKLSLCALSDREIGADVERERPFNASLARRFFTKAEQAYILRATDQAYTFTQVWTLKESFLKATGQGLKLPLNSFSVSLNGLSSEGCDGWSFWHRVQDGFHFAVCVKGASAEPDIFEKTIL